MNKPTTRPNRYLALAGIFLTLGAAAVLIYANAIEAPFVLDDFENITQNAHIRLTKISVDALTGILDGPSANRPFAMFTFALNYYFHHYQVAGYHVVNLMIHIINAFLVYLLARQTLGLCRNESFFLPFLAALLWLASPLHTQSVTYVIQRMNSLAAMFYLLTLIYYAQARLISNRKNSRRPISCILFAAALFSACLAFASKANTATLPVMLFLYEWYFFQQTKKDWLKQKFNWIAAVAALSLALVFIYLGSSPFHEIFSRYNHQIFGPVQRLLSEPRVIIYYLCLLFFPHPARLNFDYDFPVSRNVTDPLTTLPAMGALLALFALAVYTGRKNRLLSFGILWFLGTLLIESSVIGLALIFEHRTYLPSIFLFITVCSLIGSRIQKSLLAIGVLCTVAITVCGYWTWQRNDIWTDRISLWQDTVDKSPKKASAWNGLADAYYKDSRFQDALDCFNRSISLDSGYYDALNNKGSTLILLDRSAQAGDCLKKAINLNPDFYQAYYNMGCCLTKLEQSDRAVGYFKKAINLNPDFYQAYYNMGCCLAKLEQPDRAVRYFKKARKLKPASYETDYNLACLYARQNNIEKAVAALKKAVEKGYDCRKCLKTNPDLQNLRHTGYYKQLLESKKSIKR